MKEIRILTPNGGLGAGFPEESFIAGMKMQPHLIATDAGTVDVGPYPLGSGTTFEGKHSIMRDLEIIMVAAKTAGIPVIIGSATTTGAKPALKWTVDIVKEIAKKHSMRIKIAVISADFSKDYLKQELQNGKIITFESGKELLPSDIENSTYIVGQMGVEPFIAALKYKPDIIIAGRAYDPAVIAAFPITHGFDPGLAIHMGKILECGCMACEPGSGMDVILGTIREDYFIVEPASKNRRCTKTSVAAHTFYEKPDPIKLELPGGMLDLSNTKFEEVSSYAVKVSGSKFIKQPYTIKLEGARKTGYRTIFIAGIRDPLTVKNFDLIKNSVIQSVQILFKKIPLNDYQIVFHVYGKDGVMGALESIKTPAHELGIVGEVVAKNQELANEICGQLFHYMLHMDYPGRKSTAGNLAFLYSPPTISVGETYEFSIYHLLKIDDPVAPFPISIEEI